MECLMPKKPMVSKVQFFGTDYTIVRLPDSPAVYIQEDSDSMHAFFTACNAAQWLNGKREDYHNAARDERMQEIVEEKVEKLLHKVEAEMDYMTFGDVEVECQYFDNDVDYDDYSSKEYVDVEVVVRISLADIFEQARRKVNHG